MSCPAASSACGVLNSISMYFMKTTLLVVGCGRDVGAGAAFSTAA
jgi:hypothetical protein